jgi:hypothetical protein
MDTFWVTLATFLLAAWSRPRAARPKTTDMIQACSQIASDVLKCGLLRDPIECPLFMTLPSRFEAAQERTSKAMEPLMTTTSTRNFKTLKETMHTSNSREYSQAVLSGPTLSRFTGYRLCRRPLQHWMNGWLDESGDCVQTTSSGTCWPES